MTAQSSCSVTPPRPITGNTGLNCQATRSELIRRFSIREKQSERTVVSNPVARIKQSISRILPSAVSTPFGRIRTIFSVTSSAFGSWIAFRSVGFKNVVKISIVVAHSRAQTHNCHSA